MGRWHNTSESIIMRYPRTGMWKIITSQPPLVWAQPITRERLRQTLTEGPTTLDLMSRLWGSG